MGLVFFLLLLAVFLVVRRGTRLQRAWINHDGWEYQGALYTWRTYCEDHCGIAEIDTMSGEDFEQRLATLFRDNGYAVSSTPRSQDYGADLVIEKGGETTVVQAKRWDGAVGVNAVQEVHAAVSYYGAKRSLVVTNSRFTRQAVALAESTGVRLWDRQRLLDALRETAVDLPREPNPQPPRFPKPEGYWAGLLLRAQLGATKRFPPRG